MKTSLLSIVACPLCKSPLYLAKDDGLLVCRAERLAFPIEGDQPLLLESSAKSLSVAETDRLTRHKGSVE